MSETLAKVPETPWLWSYLIAPQMVYNPIPSFMEGFDKYGSIYKMRGFRPITLLREPEHAQHVLQKNHRNYHKSRIQSEILASQLGKGLLTSNGDYWLRQRKLIQPGFHRHQLRELLKIMQGETSRFLEEVLDGYAESGEAFDFARAMMQVTFRVVSRSLFKSGIADSELDRVGDITLELQHLLVTYVRGIYKIPFYYLTGKMKYYADLRAEMYGLIEQTILERQESGERYDDLLDMLLAVRYEDTGEGMTLEQLRDECLILFVAGHETSANALAWTFYQLMQHRGIEEKARSEALEVVGEGDVEWEHVPQLGYIKQVVQETMRLYPPAWIFDRMALAEDEIGGYRIEEGQPVGVLNYALHRNPKHWEKPEEFDPNRFTKENIKKRHRFAYLPFGGGPRLCIGHNFAYMEMQLIMANLLIRYDFELISKEVEMEPLVTLRPRNGIQMRIRRR